MAIQEATQTVEVSTERRTSRIEIYSDKGAEPRLIADREIIKTSEGAMLSKTRDGQVERGFSRVASESFTCADGTVITVPQLAEVLAGLVDRWYQQDRGL
jgi:hypothetical protein